LYFIPLLIKRGIWSSNCPAPPISTPIAKAKIGCAGKREERNKIDEIIARFNTTGEKAGKAKWRHALSIPITRALRQMKIINGNIILVSCTLREKASLPLNPGTITLTMDGAKKTQVSVIRKEVIKRRLITVLANFHASTFSFFSKYSLKTGMKDALRAPSPRSCLRRLGIIKATKKASLTKVAPNLLAISISLTYPNTLDVIVPKPTTLTERVILFIIEYISILSTIVEDNFPSFKIISFMHFKVLYILIKIPFHFRVLEVSHHYSKGEIKIQVL
jgi:hypothetical protein